MTEEVRAKLAQILNDNHGLSKKHLASLVADGVLHRVKDLTTEPMPIFYRAGVVQGKNDDCHEKARGHTIY